MNDHAGTITQKNLIANLPLNLHLQKESKTLLLYAISLRTTMLLYAMPMNGIRSSLFQVKWIETIFWPILDYKVFKGIHGVILFKNDLDR